MSAATNVRIRWFIGYFSWYMSGLIVGAIPGFSLGEFGIILGGAIIATVAMAPVLVDAIEQRLTREEKRDRVRS